MAAGRRALVVATYEYADTGLRRLTAPQHDAESLAAVLADEEIAGFDVTTLVNQPHHVVGEAIADFYSGCRRDDLALLYFSGHGLKDDEGRLHLAMTNTRRDALLFTAISAAQLDDAMDACTSRRKVLVLDCCYSGAFPAGRTAKADEGVQTLERFQGKGRAVLTASDATQYAFEGDALTGSAPSSVFTRHLVDAIRTGAADLDEDGDIALDELYSYVRERVVAEMPQMRPKKQEDVDGRIVIARNVHWSLPAHLRYAIESPIAAQRFGAVEGLVHLHRTGNASVRTAVEERLAGLAADDSRSVSTAAAQQLAELRDGGSRSAASIPPAARPAPAPATDPAPSVPPDTTRERPAAQERQPPSAPSPAPRGPLLPAALIVAGALLTVSRFLVFEPTNGYHAVDLGWSTLGWVVQALLPLVAALVLLLLPAGAGTAPALAVGLAGGVVLGLVDQLVMSALVTTDPDVSYALGPAWWLVLVAAGVLTVGVVAALRGTGLRTRVAVRRDRTAALGAAVTVAAGVGWVLAPPVSVDFGWWLYLPVAGLLLAAVCLAVAVLRLTSAQRTAGLAATTTTATWLAVVGVEVLAVQPSGSQPGPLLVALALVLATVGGAWLGALTGSGPWSADGAARR
ncbi:caspase family protein [Blastococcus sp. SYSU D00922]